jgi:predicted DNA-binding protein (UPF0251 family)
MSANLPLGPSDVLALDCDLGSFPRAADPLAAEKNVSLPSDVVNPPVRDPKLWLYRERTIALLKRYLRFSIEVGRLPSLLGREFFRSRVTSYRTSSFEDAVIFVHDVEQALDHLDEFAKELVATIVFQDYTQDEAAEVLHISRRTICREFPETVDRITQVFLEGGLLNQLPPVPVEKTCQEAKTAGIASSACKHGE